MNNTWLERKNVFQTLERRRVDSRHHFSKCALIAWLESHARGSSSLSSSLVSESTITHVSEPLGDISFINSLHRPHGGITPNLLAATIVSISIAPSLVAAVAMAVLSPQKPRPHTRCIQTPLYTWPLFVFSAQPTSLMIPPGTISGLTKPLARLINCKSSFDSFIQ